MKFQREVATFWTPQTGLISTTTSDSPGSVTFDWFSIWRIIRACDPRPTAALMVHTHPEGMTDMSKTDRNMVYGWCVALGIPIRFVIVCRNDGGKWCHDYWCEFRNGKFSITDIGLWPSSVSFSWADHLLYVSEYALHLDTRP